MTRDEIANLIRNEYDPKPAHWKADETGWDDGADAIADKILSFFERAEPPTDKRLPDEVF